MLRVVPHYVSKFTLNFVPDILLISGLVLPMVTIYGSLCCIILLLDHVASLIMKPLQI